MELADVKAIVFDLDGTLLNSRKEVSERSKNAILEARKKELLLYLLQQELHARLKYFFLKNCKTLQPLFIIMVL